MKLITSESVSIGHPDKVCDQMSDAVLDACLKDDPGSRVACEVMCTTQRAVVAGEITTKSRVDIGRIVRGVAHEIGYVGTEGFDADGLEAEVHVHCQSPDIAMGVDGDGSKGIGAGDQGMMFGYACGGQETEYMPVPIWYAHQLSRRMDAFRVNDAWGRENLLPDGKCQLTFDMDSGILVSAVISQQHRGTADPEELKHRMTQLLMQTVPGHYFGEGRISPTKVFVNPTGRFVTGGPDGDTGLTGRKIVVDTYGGVGHVGGGAFSGKDPTKVDRSAAYMARLAAKTLVRQGMCRRCEVSVAYGIGLEEPLQVSVDSFGTGNDSLLSEQVRSGFDFRPAAIIERLGLRRPEGWTYRQTAMNGHFGNPAFPWERTED